MTTSKPDAKIRLIVFDWAGTTVDHGCFAPVVPFVEALGHFGVQVTIDEAREPMGLGKRDHLKTLLQMPRIREQWQARHGRAWTEEDLDRAYHEQFVPRQLASVRDHSELIPGLLDAVAWLRNRGIKIGTSTGYFGDAARLAYAAAAEQGFRPDHNVTPDEVATGRPAPWMIYRNMEALGVYPASAVVKIGDTVPDIAEGLNAGVWSVGVTHTGSDVGLSAKDYAALAPAEREARADRARIRLVNAGAHLVIPSICDVPALIATIERWLAEGELPQKY
ncbi:MAG TPA: phosphonoacetaldehyde hydrolase [Pirellulales bacterium]|nr:phosphonoacetaldehyde hydrolase [Pirellulales bacterium]